jgi:hypothetical protein
MVRAILLALVGLGAASTGGCGTIINITGCDEVVPCFEVFGGLRVDERHLCNPEDDWEYCRNGLIVIDSVFCLVADLFLLPLSLPMTSVRVFACDGDSNWFVKHPDFTVYGKHK